MLSIQVSWGNKTTSLNGTFTSITHEVFILKQPHSSHPFPSPILSLSLSHSSLELICFTEGRALNSLSKKPLQTGKCEYSRFTVSTVPTHECLPLNYFPPWDATRVPKVLIHGKLQQTTFVRLFICNLTREILANLSKVEHLEIFSCELALLTCCRYCCLSSPPTFFYPSMCIKLLINVTFR